MPEGDVVWRTASRLHQALAGRELIATELRHPRLALVDLAGAVVTEVVARGKHLLIRTSAATTLHSHLRMDGSWWTFAAGERWRGPAHEIRVVLRTAGPVAVGYRLHDLAVVATAQEATLVGHLGPDLLAPEWDPDEAVRRLRLAPERPIGLALLDQRNLAGIGNIYRAETLFLRGVDPWTPVGAVADLAALVTMAKRLLTANRDRARQSTTGSLARGQELWVYGRRHRPCRRCATPIEAAPLGEGAEGPNPERTVFWCRRCQPRIPAAQPGTP